MQIKFKIGKFLEALNLVLLTIDKTGNLETKDVLFSAVKDDTNQKLYLYSTDYTTQSAIKFDVEVKEAGDIMLNPNQLLISLSNRDPESEAIISTTEKQCVIKIGKSKFQLKTTGKLNLLPRLKAMPFGWKPDLLFTHDKLTDIFTRAKSCVSTDVNNTNKYIMRGMHLKNSEDSYVMRSTDGFSGCSISISTDKKVPNIDLIIPGEFTGTLLKVAAKAKKTNVEISLVKTEYIFFGLPDYLVGTSVLNGKFPDIDRVIHKPKVLIKVSSALLKASITRILGFETFAIQGKGLIALSVEGNTLNIKSTSHNEVEEFIDFKYEENEPIPNHVIKISGQKLLEIVNTFSLGEVTLGISDDKTQPLYLEESIPDKLCAKYVMSPVRS